MYQVALANWDFDVAIDDLCGNVGRDHSKTGTFLRLLADTGHLDRALAMLPNVSSQFWAEAHAGNAEHGKSTIALAKILTSKFAASIYSLGPNEDSALQIARLASNGDYKAIVSILEKDGPPLSLKLTAEQAMFVNFGVNRLVSSGTITQKAAAKVLFNFCTNSAINDTRKKYLIASLISHFANAETGDFFSLRDNFYNHIQRIFFELQKWVGVDPGARKFEHLLRDNIKTRNNLRITRNSKAKPKVAVLVSGMYRLDGTAIPSIMANVVEPNDADVFLHTWTKQQSWVGNDGGNREGFLRRIFGPDGGRVSVGLVSNFSKIKQLMPTTANLLEVATFAPLQKESVTRPLKPVDFEIEDSDEAFLRDGVNKSYETRGNLNQAKMFYGLHRCINMMKRREAETRSRYDYVIRCRIDIGFKNKLSPADLNNLDERRIALFMGDYGPNDMHFYGRRDALVEFADIWPESLQACRVSPIEGFPQYDSHALLLAWAIEKEIGFSKSVLHREEMVPQGQNVTICGLADAINADLDTMAPSTRLDDSVQNLVGFLRTRMAAKDDIHPS